MSTASKRWSRIARALALTQSRILNENVYRLFVNKSPDIPPRHLTSPTTGRNRCKESAHTFVSTIKHTSFTFMLFDERKYFATRQPVAFAHHHLRVRCSLFTNFLLRLSTTCKKTPRQIKIMFAAMSCSLLVINSSKKNNVGGKSEQLKNEEHAKRNTIVVINSFENEWLCTNSTQHTFPLETKKVVCCWWCFSGVVKLCNVHCDDHVHLQPTSHELNRSLPVSFDNNNNNNNNKA